MLPAVIPARGYRSLYVAQSLTRPARLQLPTTRGFARIGERRSRHLPRIGDGFENSASSGRNHETSPQQTEALNRKGGHFVAHITQPSSRRALNAGRGISLGIPDKLSGVACQFAVGDYYVRDSIGRFRDLQARCRCEISGPHAGARTENKLNTRSKTQAVLKSLPNFIMQLLSNHRIAA